MKAMLLYYFTTTINMQFISSWKSKGTFGVCLTLTIILISSLQKLGKIFRFWSPNYTLFSAIIPKYFLVSKLVLMLSFFNQSDPSFILTVNLDGK